MSLNSVLGRILIVALLSMASKHFVRFAHEPLRLSDIGPQARLARLYLSGMPQPASHPLFFVRQWVLFFC